MSTMSKIRSLVSKSKIKISKELLNALDVAQLPDDVLEQIIFILLKAQEAKRKKGASKDIVPSRKPDISTYEMLVNTYNRLDGLIERTEDIKSSVNAINVELQKLGSY